MAEMKVALCAGGCGQLLPMVALPHSLTLVEKDPEVGEVETPGFCCVPCFETLRQRAEQPRQFMGLRPVLE